jgi:hypothetical protein
MILWNVIKVSEVFAASIFRAKTLLLHTPLFYPKRGGSRYFPDVGTRLPNHTASNPRIL